MRRLVVVCLVFCCFVGKCEAAKQPNVVILYCDDLGYGDLSCYGHDHIKTPRLDRLASEGIRFTDYYSPSPLCSPSRAGLMTGRNPTRLGVYSWIAGNNPMELQADEVTVAELLQDAGYRTCLSGKWHLNGYFNDRRQLQPGDHGFDSGFATQNNAAPRHENPRNFVRNGTAVGPVEGFSCQLVVDEAIRWLKETDGSDKPYFLYLAFHESHEPVESPDDLVAKHLNAGFEKDQAEYFANVENVDSAIGRFLDLLDKRGERENTCVVFSSDNGPETLNRYRNAYRSYGSPGPLRGMKLHLHDGGIRVPGMIRYSPVVEAGRVDKTPVGSVDLLPTICELADVDTKDCKPLDGTSIVPLLREQNFVREKPLFWHFYTGLGGRDFAMRDGDWSIVAKSDSPFDGGGGSLQRGQVAQIKASKLTEFELFRVADDIDQSDDLQESAQDVFERMKSKAIEIYDEIVAEGPEWEFPEKAAPVRK